MLFVCFHFMPWPHLPPDFEERHESAWLTCPNRLYDPVRGHRLYAEYRALHDHFAGAAKGGDDVLHRLRALRNEATR